LCVTNNFPERTEDTKEPLPKWAGGRAQKHAEEGKGLSAVEGKGMVLPDKEKKPTERPGVESSGQVRPVRGYGT